MSQEFLIEEYLKQGNTLTPLEALKKFGCFRLSGRILELRQKGYEIKTEIVKDGKKHYARYSLQYPIFKEEKNGQLVLV